MTANAASRGAAGQTERRVHHKVREVFSEACALIAPTMGREAGPDTAAANILRQRYPELSALEIHVLLTAAVRARQQASSAA